MIKDTLHLKAPGNWINDPNGFIYYRGKYHLFYQHFPYAPQWGTMHWGHAVSEDLIHWEHQKVALLPTKDYDRSGIFSGSALEADGKLMLYYSAVKYLQDDPENIHVCAHDSFLTSQAMLISEDGESFDNWNAKKQIIPVIADCAYGDARDTRDPKVWKEGEAYFMILGSTYYKEQGRVLFYKSKDAEKWVYAGQHLFQGMGHTMECPDLFQVDGQYVFVGSPMGLLEDGLEYSAHSICTLADFDARKCELEVAQEYQYIDYGLDYYAPQTNVDAEGRRVIIGWMRMPETVASAGDERGPWNGMMSLPRLVEVRDGHICFPVHPAVDAYFRTPADAEAVAEAMEGGKPLRIRTSLQEGETLDIGGCRITRKDGAVQMDRSRVYADVKNHRLTAATPSVEGACRLDIFVEPNLIEVFVNEGTYVISQVVYGLGTSVDGQRELEAYL